MKGGKEEEEEKESGCSYKSQTGGGALEIDSKERCGAGGDDSTAGRWVGNMSFGVGGQQ